MIQNIEEILKLIDDNKWDDAKSITQNSAGAAQAINAIKSLLKNGVTNQEIRRLQALKDNMTKLMSTGWLSEFDEDYFTLLFAYVEHIGRTLNKTT
ncbi:MAG: hypothetical protein QXJ17_01805 [Nitrososphaeria archaeon]